MGKMKEIDYKMNKMRFLIAQSKSTLEWVKPLLVNHANLMERTNEIEPETYSTLEIEDAWGWIQGIDMLLEDMKSLDK